MGVEVRGPDMTTWPHGHMAAWPHGHMGFEGRSGGARLRARLELQVPREPGVLAVAHGRGVGPPVAADRAALRLPAVALLLLHLPRGGVELILPLLHDLLAILLREEVAAADRLRSTIVQAPGRHEVLPPLQQLLDAADRLRAARHVLPLEASLGHGFFLKRILPSSRCTSGEMSSASSTSRSFS